MNIADILRHKHTSTGVAVVTIAPDKTVHQLLALLAEHNVGALIVVDGDTVAGIVSERDVVRRIAADGADVLTGPVAGIMTTSVLSCASGDSVDTVASTMTDSRVRHMPVIDDDHLVGVISIGDVVVSRIRQLEHDRGQLEQYISG